MTNNSEDPNNKKQEDADMDNPAKPFANSREDSAAEINAPDPKAMNYMEKEDTGPEGPNWKEDSEEPDGDTSENAGVFK